MATITTRTPLVQTVPAHTMMSAQITGNLCLPVSEKPDYAPEAKCVMTTTNGMIGVKLCENGVVKNCTQLIPDIDDVRIIRDDQGKERAVIVRFADGSDEKAAACGSDPFSLEQGVGICIAKRVIGAKAGWNCGSAMYNKIVKRALNIKAENDQIVFSEQAELEAYQRKMKKLAEKKRKRKERLEAAKLEREIEIHKEAYLRAMKEFHGKA